MSIKLIWFHSVDCCLQNLTIIKSWSSSLRKGKNMIVLVTKYPSTPFQGLQDRVSNSVISPTRRVSLWNSRRIVPTLFFYLMRENSWLTFKKRPFWINRKTRKKRKLEKCLDQYFLIWRHIFIFFFFFGHFYPGNYLYLIIYNLNYTILAERKFRPKNILKIGYSIH